MAKKETIECPVCGISCKVENIENHLRKVHPGKDVDLEELDMPKVRKKPRKAKPLPGERPWIKWLAVVIVVIIVAAVATVVLLPSEEGEEGPPDAINFTAIDVDGDFFSLNANIGPAPILLEFCNPNGEPCKQMASVLTNLSAHFGSSLKMVSVTTRTDGEMRYFRDYYGADWIHAGDINSELLTKYGVATLPSFFLIDRNGKIRFEHSGLILLGDLIDVIEDWT